MGSGTFLTAAQVRARYGDVSAMTIWRWLRDDTMAFPKPIYLGRRRYWRLRELEAFERRRAGAA